MDPLMADGVEDENEAIFVVRVGGLGGLDRFRERRKSRRCSLPSLS